MAEQFAQRWTGIVVMGVQNLPAGVRDVSKLQRTFQKPLDRDFIRGVEHRTTRTASPRDFKPELQRRESIEVRGEEVELV